MDTQAIVRQLKEQKAAIEKALEVLGGSGKRPYRRKVRTMSAEARKKISAAQKRRWAAQKKK